MFTFADLKDIRRVTRPILAEWTTIKHVTLEFDDRDRVILERSNDGFEDYFAFTYVDGAAPDVNAPSNPNAACDARDVTVNCDC